MAGSQMEPEVVGRGCNEPDATKAPIDGGSDDECLMEYGAPCRSSGSRGARNASQVAKTGIQWQGRRVAWLGRICVVRVRGHRAVFIGPHWFCTAIMLGVVVGAGSFFVLNVAVRLHTAHIVLGVVCTLATSEALIRCALVEPGILLPEEDGPLIEPSQAGGYVCTECRLVQPKGAEHCDFCMVCVAGYDHHCPWMGKCIGEANLAEFYAFLCTAFGSLAYIVITAMMN